IQGKAPFHNDDKIQLGYKAFNEGTHIISVFKAEGIFAEEQNIYLVDKLLHKTVNLSVKPYKFLTRAGQFNDRFEIIYKNKNIFSTVQDTVEPLLITVTRQSEDLLIMSQGEKLSEVIVYNLLGKPVFTYKNLNTQELRIPAAEYTKQILIVNIVTQSGNAVSQKVIPK
ncbi:MAG: T9SS sorting signal type C domain-containing protein, partial [Moheibacter sp.]